MKTKKVKINNFELILDKIKGKFQSITEKEEKEIWVDALNEMLDDLRDNDFFGTEGQCDPRIVE